MDRYKLDRKFLKSCPTCKKYFPNAWKECPTCKKVLRSIFLKYYVVEPFKKVLSPFAIILLCVYSTYGIQSKERVNYINGFNLLINKEFGAGWGEIRGALTKNPLYNYVRSLVGGIKGKISEAKKERYILREVFFDVNSKRNSALINDRVVFEGDSVGDFKIIKINIDSVDIETDGKQRNIKFSTTWN